MKARALAMMLSACVVCGAAAQGEDENFDWLRAENGREVFRGGFASADVEQAAEFVVTGVNPQTVTMGVYEVVLRGGRYYSNEENTDDSRDVPASAEVLRGGRRLFAAKGYKFVETRAARGAIVIRHWNGAMGCTFTDYYLRPTDAGLTLAKTQMLSTSDNSVCEIK